MAHRRPFAFGFALRRSTLMLLCGVVLSGAVTRLAAAPATQPGQREFRSTPADAPVNLALKLERIDRTGMPLRIFVARVDLTAAGPGPDFVPRIRTVPAGEKGGEKGGGPGWPTTLETVGNVAEREAMDLALNGDFFTAARATASTTQPGHKKYLRGDLANVIGNVVTDGKTWAQARQPVSMLVVSDTGAVSIVRQKLIPKAAKQVISGNYMLVDKGAALIPHNEKEQRNPRSLVGLTADSKTLLLVVVDGRSIRSRGVTLGEAAEIMVELGADKAFNLDGGGSSTLIYRNAKGDRVVFNNPSDGEQRPVANVLGLKFPPSPPVPPR